MSQFEAFVPSHMDEWKRFDACSVTHAAELAAEHCYLVGALEPGPHEVQVRYVGEKDVMRFLVRSEINYTADEIRGER